MNLSVAFFGLVLLLSLSTHVFVSSKLKSFRRDVASLVGLKGGSEAVSNERLADALKKEMPQRAPAPVLSREDVSRGHALAAAAQAPVWRVANETQQVYEWMRNHLLRSHNVQRGALEPRVTRVCLPISITTRGTKWKSLSQTLLLTSFLPSLVKTVEPGFVFGVYLGYDEGDPLLDSEAAQRELKNLTAAIIGDAAIEMRSFCYADSRNRNVWAVNYITRECYLDGYDYFYRVNDDSAMEGVWASHLTRRLLRTNDFGVVGTLDKGNPRIFTHSLVGRPHLEVFGYYFPFEFGNYWSDDWITEVYEAPYVHKAYDVLVKHHIHAERYRVEFERKNLLEVMVNLCRKRWKAYLCVVRKRKDYCSGHDHEFRGIWPE